MTESPVPPTAADFAARLVAEVETITAESATPFFEAAMRTAESKGYASALSDHDTLKADAKRAQQVKPLGSYEYGDLVEVFFRGEWIPGRVNNANAATGLVSVDTERGPKTINSTRSIRLVPKA